MKILQSIVFKRLSWTALSSLFMFWEAYLVLPFADLKHPKL